MVLVAAKVKKPPKMARRRMAKALRVKCRQQQHQVCRQVLRQPCKRLPAVLSLPKVAHKGKTPKRPVVLA